MVMVFWIVETVKSCPACVVCPISTISGDDDGDGDDDDDGDGDGDGYGDGDGDGDDNDDGALSNYPSLQS